MARLTDLVTLIVLDGWGIAPPTAGNAITQADTPNIEKFWVSYPHTLLSASGESVGLPRGEPGNTETGHLNLGAGRIVYQDLPRINLSIAEGSFFKNPSFLGAINHAKENNSNLHIMGLVGSGGVHSNIEHLFALIHLARLENFPRVFIHIFTDGRDSPPASSLTYINQVEEAIKKEGVGTIASVCGRYWAMDRDFRWERTAKAYFTLTRGDGHKASNVKEVIENSYKEQKADEFIEPTLIVNKNNYPLTLISDNDAVIFFNFRIDRPRQLTKAFVLPNFEETAQKEWDFDPFMVKYYKKHLTSIPQRPVFQRGNALKNLFFVTMTQYAKSLPVEVAFPPEIINLPVGRILSEKGIRQLRVTESEKERFVTFYFNGQQEQAFAGEDRLIIPSPAVPTYDQKPEMSALELTNALISTLRLNLSTYGFVLVNFANPDMLGHTGEIKAAIKACSVVDQCVGQITTLVDNLGGITIITADHGNAEEMLNLISGESNTEHSSNPVPFIMVGKQFLGRPLNLSSGILSDVAPTILYLLGLEKPSEMSGKRLLE